jgi:hypothetical protein
VSISAKKIGFKVNGVLVEGTYRISARGKVDELDRTTGSDNGYANFDGGVKEMRVSATVYIDLTTGFGVSIEEGDVLEDVNLYRDLDDTPGTVMPLALVVSANDNGEVRGKLEYELELVAKGEYTRAFP